MGSEYTFEAFLMQGFLYGAYKGFSILTLVTEYFAKLFRSLSVSDAYPITVYHKNQS